MIMTALQMNEFTVKNDNYHTNYSDDELVLREYHLKCNYLQSLNKGLIIEKQNLIILNEKSEDMSKCLLRIKKEYELYKSDLSRSLYCQKVRAAKEKIVSDKMIKKFWEKTMIEEHSKRSPTAVELEDLLRRNEILSEECKKLNNLLELTKTHYNGLINVSIKDFRKKVCEFCDAVLKLNAFSD